jgi:hypothetical protein
MSKPGGGTSSGISLGDVLRLPKRHPACRRREAQLGSCTERENLDGDAKGKGASGSNREAESTDAPGRGGLLRSSEEAGVMPVERREQAIAIWLGSTGNGRNPMFNGRRQPSCDGTSRMTRECQVRFFEGLGVKLPGPTRQRETFCAACATLLKGQHSDRKRAARLGRNAKRDQRTETNCRPLHNICGRRSKGLVRDL